MVIHKNEFKNAEGDHTNSIESVWSQLKNWISSMHGMDHEHLDSYLSEFTFRFSHSLEDVEMSVMIYSTKN